MTDLQKRIEELKEIATPDKYSHFLANEHMSERQLAKQALSIIEELQKERDTYKISWESDSEASKVIIEELKNENKAYIECLRRINSCDDSATQQSKEVHQVLRQFGKL